MAQCHVLAIKTKKDDLQVIFFHILNSHIEPAKGVYSIPAQGVIAASFTLSS